MVLGVCQSPLTWNLAIGSHVPLSEKQDQLLFGKLRIHLGKWQHVESQVPGCILGGGRRRRIGRGRGRGRGRERKKERKSESVFLSQLHNQGKTLLTHPGILPLVRHGDDVTVEEVNPLLGIAAPPAALGGVRMLRVSLQPRLHNVVVELLRP